MGHQVNIGDFTGVSGQVQILVGDFNKMEGKLDATGQTELAKALQTLVSAVLASKDLSEDEKQDQVAMITQIGEEAAKPKPNKPLLKALSDGAIKALQVIPDVANAVVAVAPLLSQLHL